MYSFVWIIRFHSQHTKNNLIITNEQQQQRNKEKSQFKLTIFLMLSKSEPNFAKRLDPVNWNDCNRLCVVYVHYG